MHGNKREFNFNILPRFNQGTRAIKRGGERQRGREIEGVGERQTERERGEIKLA